MDTDVQYEVLSQYIRELITAFIAWYNFVLSCGLVLAFGCFGIYTITKYVFRRIPDDPNEDYGAKVGAYILALSITLHFSNYIMPFESFPWFVVLSAPVLVILVGIASFFIHIPMPSPSTPTQLPPSLCSDVYTCPHCYEETPYDQETRYCMGCGKPLPVTGLTIHLGHH